MNKYGNVYTNEVRDDLPAVDTSRGIAGEAGMIYMPSAADLWRVVYRPSGWRQVAVQEEVPEGFRRESFVVSAVPGEPDACTVANGVLINLADEAAAAAAAEAAAVAADLAAHAERYTLENLYLLLCDQLRGDASHAKIGMLEMAERFSALRGMDAEVYGRLRDGFQFCDAGLTRYDAQWWDVAQYRDVPALVAGAAALLKKL